MAHGSLRCFIGGWGGGGGIIVIHIMVCPVGGDVEVLFNPRYRFFGVDG